LAVLAGLCLVVACERTGAGLTVDERTKRGLSAASEELFQTVGTRGVFAISLDGERYRIKVRFEKDTGLTAEQLQRNVTLILRKHVAAVSDVSVDTTPAH